MLNIHQGLCHCFEGGKQTVGITGTFSDYMLSCFSSFPYVRIFGWETFPVVCANSGELLAIEP